MFRHSFTENINCPFDDDLYHVEAITTGAFMPL